MSIIEGAIADLLTGLNVSLPSTSAGIVSTLVSQVMQERLRQKQDLIIQEIREGNISVEAIDDEFISSVWRIHMSIMQGISNENLRLLAKVLVGLIKTDRQIYADEFLHYSAILEGVSYNEIIILGRVLAHQASYERDKEAGIAEPETPGTRLEADLVGSDKIFQDRRELLACCAGLSRTGLILPVSGWGGMIYSPSPQLYKLRTLIEVDIETLVN